MVATGSGGTYTSTNSGGTWRSSSITGVSAASSADGIKLIICNNYFVYTSTNCGINWTTISPSGYWFSVASSADGGELLAGENQGIWICHATPFPLLNITLADTNLDLSWLVPSTNLVLQQSPDLISWSSVTSTPALNFTNLQNQATFPATNGIGFFRLATP
jgi:hypothetical protein